MKEFFKRIHLWLSLPIGIIIIILCLTGAILVFQQPILEWLNPETFYVEKTEGEPMPISRLYYLADKQLSDSIQLSSVTIFANKNRNYSFSIEGQHHASMNIDPYTGQVKNQRVKGQAFFGTVLRLHRWLLFPMSKGSFSLGKFLIGISTLFLLFIIISGIVIWIPKSFKLLKQRLSIKTGKGTYRFLYDTHLAGGIYAAIFLLALCLTGLTWSFNWYGNGFYKIFGVETTQYGHGFQHENKTGNRSDREINKDEETANWEHHKSTENKTFQHNENKQQHKWNRQEDINKTEYVHNGEKQEFNLKNGSNNQRSQRSAINYKVWDNVLAKLEHQVNNYQQITIDNGTALVSTDKKQTRAVDRYTFDTTTGKITNVVYFKDTTDRASKLRMWIYMVHVGKWGGWVTQILTFLAALIGASLPITGYYMYFKKIILKRKKKK